jgi:photosynthetic reaction center H subunit
MTYGAILERFDIAQVAIYVFWGSFAGLIYFLRREDHREGYPLQADHGESDVIQFPPAPAPKTFIPPHGHVVQAPRPEEAHPVAGEQVQLWAGAPYMPKGDPLLTAVGPAAYTPNRFGHPEIADEDGKPKIVPLRAAHEFFLAPEDVDPRHFDVIANDGKVIGQVVDLWVDRAEVIIRFLEIERLAAHGGGNIVIPPDFFDIKRKRHEIVCSALSSRQFAGVPQLSHPTTITPGEEDRISAYYGGGGLYGREGRAEPVL